jgi:hypothetical protein
MQTHHEPVVILSPCAAGCYRLGKYVEARRILKEVLLVRAFVMA